MNITNGLVRVALYTEPPQKTHAALEARRGMDALRQRTRTKPNGLERSLRCLAYSIGRGRKRNHLARRNVMEFLQWLTDQRWLVGLTRKTSSGWRGQCRGAGCPIAQLNHYVQEMR